MTRSYVLTQSAVADMREITRYSLKQWGEDQTRIYIAKLEQCAQAVVNGSAHYKNMDEFHPELRMLHCGHHYIFCLPRQAALALVVAILHERMDIMTRLRLRLAVK